MPTLRRMLINVGAFLLLGLVLNTIIAWTCAIMVTGTLTDKVRLDVEGGNLTVSAVRGFGKERFDWFSGRRRDTPVDAVQVLIDPYPAWISEWSTIDALVVQDVLNGGHYQVVQIACGWPMLAHQCEIRHGLPGDMSPSAMPDVYTSAIPLDRAEECIVPYGVIWRGFAFNTAIYAAGPWLVFFAPFQLLRTLRRVSGKCPACGYPIGVSEVCTECGKPLHSVHLAPMASTTTSGRHNAPLRHGLEPRVDE